MFCYEIHFHTKETSRCGQSSAYDMVKAYKDHGFTGIVVTDHFVNGNSFATDGKTWKEKMDLYLKGYHAAKKAGEELGIDIFLGWEFTYQCNNAEDHLTLGLDEDFLYNVAVDCDQWSIEKYAKAVHDAHGILIHAHPYRQAFYIKTDPIMRDGICDAIEVYNGGNPPGTDYDDKALAYAKEYGYPMVAGSDTHHVSTTHTGCIGFDEKPQSYRELCDFIVQGKAHVLRYEKKVATDK